MKNQLLFVYNADSGAANMLMDYGKKYITPNKYDCQLCMVSYGAFGMKKDWKKFVNSLPYISIFLHRDEFEKNYPDKTIKYPSVQLVEESGFTTILDAEDFESIKDLHTLIRVVKQKLIV
jgi:hypothetical protein